MHNQTIPATLSGKAAMRNGNEPAADAAYSFPSHGFLSTHGKSSSAHRLAAAPPSVSDNLRVNTIPSFG